MSGLTTHVLDLCAGRPAAGVRISVAKIENGQHRPIAEAITNADGRVDGPIVPACELTAGVYELAFHVGDYFADRSAGSQEARFLDVVPLRFGVGDPMLHYHVPLLVTPWSYSTYRGS